MAKKTATILGIIFILLGLVGFISPGFLHAHLSPMHNLIHIISGIVAVYVAQARSERAARNFCLGFGVFYFLLGVTGFFVGHNALEDVEVKLEAPADVDVNAHHETNHWRLIPGQLELGTRDHTLHVAIGLVFIAGGLASKRS